MKLSNAKSAKKENCWSMLYIAEQQEVVIEMMLLPVALK